MLMLTLFFSAKCVDFALKNKFCLFFILWDVSFLRLDWFTENLWCTGTPAQYVSHHKEICKSVALKYENGGSITNWDVEDQNLAKPKCKNQVVYTYSNH